jgi:hypothetical protein
MMKKRIADWSEKISAGAFLIAVFQGEWIGVIVSLVALGLSVWLTLLEKGERQ